MGTLHQEKLFFHLNNLMMVKSLPEIQETGVQSLGWEDPLEKEMATHSSNLAWRIPWMEEAVGYSPSVTKSWTPLSDFTFTFHGV